MKGVSFPLVTPPPPISTPVLPVNFILTLHPSIHPPPNAPLPQSRPPLTIMQWLHRSPVAPVYTEHLHCLFTLPWVWTTGTADYICMHIYVIRDLVNQILALMRSSFSYPSGNDIFVTELYIFKNLNPHKSHGKILFFLFQIILYWSLNQFIDCIFGHFVKREFSFKNISLVLWFFVGDIITE